MTIKGSNDTKSWKELFVTADTSSGIYQSRQQAKELVLNNNDEKYKEYKITFTMNNPLKMYLGSYGIVESYARQCTSDMFNDMTGNNVLPFDTLAPTEVPTSSPTSAAPTGVPFNNNELNEAVRLWVTNKENAVVKYGHISGWDTSLVTDMGGLFAKHVQKIDAMNYFNEDLSQWDVSSTTNMSHMFNACWSFNANLSKWDVSTVTNMDYMFYATGTFNQILCWDLSHLSNLQEMGDMFYGSPGTYKCN